MPTILEIDELLGDVRRRIDEWRASDAPPGTAAAVALLLERLARRTHNVARSPMRSSPTTAGARRWSRT